MKKILTTFAIITMLATPTLAKENRGKVVATVNGSNIYEDSVNFIYKEIPKDNVKELGGKDAVKKTITEQLAAAEALKQAALKSKVDQSETFKKLFKSEKERLIQEEYLRVSVQKKVTDTQIKSTYDKALKDFKPKTEYNIFNILSNSEKNAKNLIKQLDKGTKFTKLAVEKSIASNVKETKGDLGFVKKSDLIENVGKEITSLKTGQYSKAPVKSPFGWNVFYLKETRKEKAPTYKESKDIIKQSLYKQEMMKVIEGLKKKAEIKYF